MELNEYLSASHKKRRKRRHRIVLILGGAAICLLLAGMFWVIFRSPLFRVEHIAITGNSAVSDASVTALADAAFAAHGHLKFLGIGNMLAWPSAFASSDLVAEPQIASATLSKNYFDHTITVGVTERQPFAIWCSEQSSTDMGNADCYWFDASGVIFAEAFDTEGSLLLAVHDYSQLGLGLGKEVLPDRFVPNMISILDVLAASGLRIKEVRLDDIALEELQVTTYDGPDIYFSIRFPADDTLPVLQSLMVQPGFQKLQYVDFRTQDRAYYE